METHQEFNGVKVGDVVTGRDVTMGTTHTGVVKEIRTWDDGDMRVVLAVPRQYSPERICHLVA